jgi:hypothetical protein
MKKRAEGTSYVRAGTYTRTPVRQEEAGVKHKVTRRERTGPTTMKIGASGTAIPGNQAGVRKY